MKRPSELDYLEEETESLISDFNFFIDWQEQQITELKGLLKIAQCPNNCDDGSIAHGSNETGWEQEQCQFCDERNQALKK